MVWCGSGEGLWDLEVSFSECPGFLSAAVIQCPDRKQFGKDRFIWLSVPGYIPPGGEVKGGTEAAVTVRKRENAHMPANQLIPSRTQFRTQTQ